MADSNREKIIKRAVALLKGDEVPAGLVAGASKPAGLTVHRYRGRALQDDDVPSSIVYPLTEPAERIRSSSSKAYADNLVLRVEHRAKGEKEAPDSALDPLITWAVQVIMADETFGGLAMGIQKLKTQWDPDIPILIRESYAAAATDFQISHRTLAKNPEVRQ